MATETLALILVSIGALVFLAVALSLWRKTKHYKSKYSGIIDTHSVPAPKFNRTCELALQRIL